jgi:GTP cyclohydrolase II
MRNESPGLFREAPGQAPTRACPTTVRAVVDLPMTLPDRRTIPSQVMSFSGLNDEGEHFALKLGTPDPISPLVRLHSECVTGDVFGSARCDCGPQLNEAIRRLSDSGGYLLYLRQEGRGIGLYQKLDAYRLQDSGHDTYTANRALGRRDDERSYEVAAAMLHALSVSRIRLLSNNPDKRVQLESFGIVVDALLPTGVFVAEHNRHYLEAKVKHTKHTIILPGNEEIK